MRLIEKTRPWKHFLLSSRWAYELHHKFFTSTWKLKALPQFQNYANHDPQLTKNAVFGIFVQSKNCNPRCILSITIKISWIRSSANLHSKLHPKRNKVEHELIENFVPLQALLLFTRNVATHISCDSYVLLDVKTLKTFKTAYILLFVWRKLKRFSVRLIYQNPWRLCWYILWILSFFQDKEWFPHWAL